MIVIARLIGGFLHRSLLLNHLSPPPQKPHDTFILCNPKTYLHRVLLCNPHFEGKTKTPEILQFLKQIKEKLIDVDENVLFFKEEPGIIEQLKLSTWILH
uniref:Uncharacterized protein n=1 Tax=Lactuca sativa TaxID=4236 RepID=A0A9R1XHJ5_LACSA|nr:hypothetical protein LSAT_V11C300103500 [Lactuca sativa]